MPNNKEHLANRRDLLASAATGSFATVVDINSAGQRIRSAQAGPGELLPHYVFGSLVSATANSCLLDAPLDGKFIRENISYDEDTEIFSLYGPDLSTVPANSQIAVGTPENLRNPDGTRYATWINVNPVYSHGEVVDIEKTTVTLRQAHGGAIRKLNVTSSSMLHDAAHGVENIAVSALTPGCQVFFTGLAIDAELTSAEINIVLLHKTT